MPMFVMYDDKANVALTASGTTNGGTYSFGNATPDRIVVIAFVVNSRAASSVSAVSVAGSAATKIVGQNSGNSTAEIWAVSLPSGASGAVSITWGGSSPTFGINVYAVTGVRTVAAFATATGSSSATVSTPSAGITIGVTGWTKVTPVTTITWSNLTKNTDFGTDGSSGDGSSAASVSGTVSGSLAVSASPAAGVTTQQLAVASWAP